MPIPRIAIFGVFFIVFNIISCSEKELEFYEIHLQQNQTIALIGNNLCSRMINYDYFETYLQASNSDKLLTIRNMCDGGDTPGFRPHSGRNTPWAFEGAENFQTEYANISNSEGRLAYPDEWLTKYKTDIILAFFGYNESFEAIDSMEMIKTELTAFIKHTKDQKYNGKTAPQLVLVSPIAYEDLSSKFDLPNGKKENEKLAAYTKAMSEVAISTNTPFVNLFAISQNWYKTNKSDLTIDGFQLNDLGYKIVGRYLAEHVFEAKIPTNTEKLFTYVKDKNWYWQNLFKMPNGVHVFGRRFNPFGQDNYPYEIRKMEEMTAIRDTAIWSMLSNKPYDVANADKYTTSIPEIETNYKLEKGEKPQYLYGDEAMKSFTIAEGYQVSLFASEEEFPDLANPCQMSFDNKGRLWVAVMPSYPHYKPGESMPNDKLLILEDTNGDGKADKQTIFADKLHLPVGFELAPEGVYISQGTNLKLLTDTDGDDKADKVEIILSGFDDHDTHHVISAFCADPSGAIYMAEGVFLHTNVETPYGPVRATNGGFYRYNPNRKHLERVSQIPIPNPWGIAFDDWGQDIFAETSGPPVRWMMPSTNKSVYGISGPMTKDLIEEAHRVRPTSGLEFLSSKHFPDEVQGNFLINNTIGFLGMKMHTLKDDSTGYKSNFVLDLITSTDPNFRPVDMEFAPDGSLYFIDWHNVLIGHMQHNARDPLRDHVHGRVYRITYPSRPLVVPAKVDGASIAQLFDNLKNTDYRTRYRTKRELRGRNKSEVLEELSGWQAKLDKNDPNFEHHLLEALWVSWGINKIDVKLLNTLLNATDFRVRAAAVRALRYNIDKVPNYLKLFKKSAIDNHGRVRLETLVAVSWLSKSEAMPILELIEWQPLDPWMKNTYEAVVLNFKTRIKPLPEPKSDDVVSGLKGKDLEFFKLGKSLYNKEGNCTTCHQMNGKGVIASGFPPLVNSEWVLGDNKKLIKITLNGLMGPLKVLGKDYEGKVPMLGYKSLLTDEEVAAVLTYIRNTFGNKAAPIKPSEVKKIREQTKNKKGYYLAKEL